MGTWSCIDGDWYANWTYVSLELGEEAERVMAAIRARLPQCGLDDTALTALLSSRNQPVMAAPMSAAGAGMATLQPEYSPA